MTLDVKPTVGTDGEPWLHGRHIIRPHFIKKTNFRYRHIRKAYSETYYFVQWRGIQEYKRNSGYYTFALSIHHGRGNELPTSVLGEGTDTPSNRETRVTKAIKYVLQRQAEFFIWRAQFSATLLTHTSSRPLSLSVEELYKKLSKKDTFLEPLARRDTTAASLSFCLFKIAHNPEIVGRLQAELHSHLVSWRIHLLSTTTILFRFALATKIRLYQ
ncbi:hypothetical protein HYFRA_00002028 [Hymenoscyphus fraxineus]|uniref:Uncharacterized protein n=1 Tax=Hymenoscyphus fraxineus TaxID=746836 RepID=A0A9N9KMW8_9HELO|nr:hypothetical protein HYFRA_00002028 [Hymenoscyphus fraxineus]